MEKFQIEGDLDRSWIVSLMAEGLDTYQILKNYDVTETTISECEDLFDKEVLLQGFNFSEKFIRESIENGYLSTEDLQNLSMTTYSNLSNEFIQEQKDNLNWSKIVIYLSTQTNSFSNYLDVIKENNLWNLISGNDLPTDFVREHKDNLDWSLLSMTKCFTQEELVEFSDYIVEQKQEESGHHQFQKDEEGNPFGEFDFAQFFEKNFSVDDIAALIEKYMTEMKIDFSSLMGEDDDDDDDDDEEEEKEESEEKKEKE